MLPESVYNTHVMFNSGNAIRNISNDFLQKRGLEHFSYARRYHKSNKTFTLTTHPQISEDYFRLQFYNITKFEQIDTNVKSSVLLWLGVGKEDQKLINHVKENHDLGNGIVLIKNHEDFSEYTYFASTPENVMANNYYLANLDELYNFDFYFKEKAKKIILAAHQSAIKLPNFNPSTEADSRAQYSNGNIRPSIKEPLFKKLYYTKELNQHISKREFQCLTAMASGCRIKEIANELQLKERSVRSYIENLKNKTQLETHPQLIDFYHSLF